MVLVVPVDQGLDQGLDQADCYNGSDEDEPDLACSSQAHPKAIPA